MVIATIPALTSSWNLGFSSKRQRGRNNNINNTKLHERWQVRCHTWWERFRRWNYAIFLRWNKLKHNSMNSQVINRFTMIVRYFVEHDKRWTLDAVYSNAMSVMNCPNPFYRYLTNIVIKSILKWLCLKLFDCWILIFDSNTTFVIVISFHHRLRSICCFIFVLALICTGSGRMYVFLQ